MRRGFTLLELAVVLVLVGLMAGFAVKVMPSRDCYAETKIQMRGIKTALNNYVNNNNKYPMPSGRQYGINSPFYGVAVTDPDSASIDRTSGNTVLVGALPFATLGLGASYAGDCWGNKFTYYVTKALTDSATYAAGTSSGQITVRTGSTALTTPGPSTMTAAAAFAVVSHGEDALGASGRNFTTARNYCNTEQGNASVTRVDKENCDTTNAEVYASEFNNGANAANFFDDVVIFGNKTGFTGCNAGTVNWGAGCGGPIGALSNGASAVATNNVAGRTGSATATCTNGVLSTSGTCNVITDCPAQAVTWNTSCTGSVGALTDGNAATVTNTASNYTGSVTATCTGGSIVTSAGTCSSTAGCNAQTTTWNTNCSAAVGALSHGGSAGVTNTASGYTGSGTASCSGGVLTTTGSCSAVSNCAPQTFAWNTNCSGTTGTINHGSNALVTNTAGGYSGSVTATCTNGSLSPSGGSCTAVAGNCASQAVSWGSGCSATAGALNHGDSSGTLANTASGFTGSATATCNNGTSTASGTCNANCAAQTVSWNTNCSGSANAINHGANETVTNSASGYNGSATATCSNGTINLTDLSCATTVPPKLCYRNDQTCYFGATGPQCGKYYYADGSTAVDSYPPDASNWDTAPTDWRLCGICHAQNILWTGASDCYGEFDGLFHDTGSVTVFNGGPSGSSGSVDVSCWDGTRYYSNESCYLNTPSTNPCASDTRTWTVGGNSCTATIPSAVHGSNATGSDTVSPTLGSASFYCNDGYFTSGPQPGATCSGSAGASCTAGGQGGGSFFVGSTQCLINSWYTPAYFEGPKVVSGSCTMPYSSYSSSDTCAHGTVLVFPSFSFYNQGSIRYSCNNGTWVASEAVCQGPPRKCSPGCSLQQIGGSDTCVSNGVTYDVNYPFGTTSRPSGCHSFTCGNSGWYSAYVPPSSCPAGVTLATMCGGVPCP